jgi:hypothetical protein
VAVRVFAGNTSDSKTVSEQIRTLAQGFGVSPVTLVSGRGMLKLPHVQALEEPEFHYITAITKAQIRQLLKTGACQMHLFENEMAEVVIDNNIRYVLRRNPHRVSELAHYWRHLDLTVSEALDELGSVRGIELAFAKVICQKVPQPTGVNQELLAAAQVKLPDTLPLRKTHVATRKKLSDT